jgi:hypothetical protein
VFIPQGESAKLGVHMVIYFVDGLDSKNWLLEMSGMEAVMGHEGMGVITLLILCRGYYVC